MHRTHWEPIQPGTAQVRCDCGWRSTALGEQQALDAARRHRRTA